MFRNLTFFTNEYGKYFALPYDWCIDLKKFVEEPEDNDLNMTIDISILICKHNGILFLPSYSPQDDKNEKLMWEHENTFLVVSELEYEHLIKSFKFIGNPIELIIDEKGISFNPLPCSDCINEKISLKLEKLKNFTNASIKIDYPLAKRTRSRARRDKTTIEGINAIDLILHIKLLIFDKLEIPPSEQLLYVNDKELDDDNRTLSSYEITSEDIIRIEILEDTDIIASNRELSGESGFSETSLNKKRTSANEEDEDKWECSVCTFYNYLSSNECEMCNSKKKETIKIKKRKREDLSDISETDEENIKKKQKPNQEKHIIEL